MSQNKRQTRPRAADPLWYKDAVFYQAHVKVNLDPGRALKTELEVPLWRYGLPDRRRSKRRV